MSSLDASDVRRFVPEPAAVQLDELEAFASIDSTNTYLLHQPPPGPGRCRVAIADEQTSGRGRRSRRWISPPGSGLCLSIAYTFARRLEQLPALTLALGVGVVDALARLGVDGVSLKWPNDIVAMDRKLGGILTEVHTGSGDGVTVVAGVGINIDLPDGLSLGDASGWVHRPVDLRSIAIDVPPRERLAATIVGALVDVFARFGELGFSVFVREWQLRDWLKGREIIADMPDGRVAGTAAGVDSDGALIVNAAAGPMRVINGSIELPFGEGASR